MAQLLFENRNASFNYDFWSHYDAESDCAEWAYRIAVIHFADSIMVIANYYGGDQPFVEDITLDKDASRLRNALTIYFRDFVCSKEAWVKTDIA